MPATKERETTAVVKSSLADNPSFRPSACNPRARACNAMGDTCTKIAMPNGKCTRHNGGAKRGVESATFVHGRNSKDLTAIEAKIPAFLTEVYAELAQDWAGAVDGTPIINLQKADIYEMYGRLPSGESGEAWVKLRDRLREYTDARDRGPVTATEAESTLAALSLLVEVGCGEWELRERISTERVRFSQVASVEIKRREKASNVIAAGLVRGILRIVNAALQGHPDLLSRIHRDVATLLTGSK